MGVLTGLALLKTEPFHMFFPSIRVDRCVVTSIMREVVGCALPIGARAGWLFLLLESQLALKTWSTRTLGR